MTVFKIHKAPRPLPLSVGGGSLFSLLLLFLLLPAFPSVDAAEKKQKQPKQEKLSVLRKNAKTALKNQANQDAARNALLGAIGREELKNRQKADIYYMAALLEESLNGVENKKAYLKQAFDTARFFNKLCDMYAQLRLCVGGVGGELERVGTGIAAGVVVVLVELPTTLVPGELLRVEGDTCSASGNL